MGKITLQKKIKVCVFIILTLILTAVVYAVAIAFIPDAKSSSANSARIKFADLVYAAENGGLDNFNEYEYALADLSGTIVNSSSDDYPEGDKIDLHKFSNAGGEYKKRDKIFFISPVIKENNQVGTLIVMYSEAFVLDGGQILLFFLGILIFGIASITAYKLTEYLKNDVFVPVETLHNVTNDIIRGNYETKLAYDYDNETGRLCHDFEILRDELQNSTRRESKLKENEKLLLASISHDLKTPLAAISGYVEGIRDGIVKDSDGISSYTGIIMRKIRILSKLIDDILEHSKSELNELSIDTEEIYSRTFFKEAFKDLSIDIIRNGLTFEISDIPNVLIEIDKRRIFQVLQNIIMNSLKYTGKGGKISVGFSLYEKELVVSITDSGEGIDAADIPFIFDKFYRGEKARTMNAAGSGLGLNISRYIIKKHGGKIECDSILGHGTTISFSLPI